MSGEPTSTMLLFLGRRGCGCRKVGIPDISTTLPIAIGLLFPNLDVLAVVLSRLTAGVGHRLFVGISFQVLRIVSLVVALEAFGGITTASSE